VVDWLYLYTQVIDPLLLSPPFIPLPPPPKVQDIFSWEGRPFSFQNPSFSLSYKSLPLAIAISMYGVSMLISHLVTIIYLARNKRTVQSNWFHDIFAEKHSSLSYYLYRLVLLILKVLNGELYNKAQKVFFLSAFQHFYSIPAYLALNNPIQAAIDAALKYGDLLLCCGHFAPTLQRWKLERKWAAYSLYKTEALERRLFVVEGLERECTYAHHLVLFNFIERVPQLIAIGMIGGWFTNWLNIVKFALALLGLAASIQGVFGLWENYRTINVFTDAQDPNFVEPGHVNVKYNVPVRVQGGATVNVRVRTYYEGLVLLKNLKTDEVRLVQVDEEHITMPRLPGMECLIGIPLPRVLMNEAEKFARGG
jgi:hypothetical protein